MNFHLRPNTDDDKYIVKEIVDRDMYRLPDLIRYQTDEKYIIDCGAHIGVFSKFAHSFLPSLTFVCFEPNEENFGFLERNMSDVPNKMLFNKCVSPNPDGKLRLFCPFDKGKTGQYSATIYPYSNPNEYIDVESMDLDEFMRSLCGDVLILKMDMEGHESVVLKHMKEEYLKRVKILILEEHDDCPIDYDKIDRVGFKKLFNPFNLPRHSVYVRR